MFCYSLSDFSFNKGLYIGLLNPASVMVIQNINWLQCPWLTS
uniref:Uncharacterized protein n=1 Tax=Rhizophora mucronata TaxID=61149 RepID=A0A2P2KDV5_RHIMU